VKESLAEVIRRKQEIERIVREKAEREQEINAIGQEQARIRENMGRLERTSDLYTRYVQKFSQQESRIETLREEIAQRQSQEQQARKGLDEFLLQLDVK
jgi:flagellar biosynthesis chaperone FliJ